MATLEQFVRYHGSSFREHISKTYMVNGDEAGEACCRRWLWEIVDHATEVHGPTVAQDMLRDALDGLKIDAPPMIAEPEGVADPFEAAIQRNSAAVEAQGAGFASLCEHVGELATAVREIRRPLTARERIRQIWERVQWWPLVFCAGLVIAEALK